MGSIEKVPVVGHVLAQITGQHPKDGQYGTDRKPQNGGAPPSDPAKNGPADPIFDTAPNPTTPPPPQNPRVDPTLAAFVEQVREFRKKRAFRIGNGYSET